MTMRRPGLNDSNGQETAELAALADGSLAADRRADLEARVAASPELAELLAEQERAVSLAESAAGEVEAPASLRARLETQRRPRRARAPRRLALVGAVTVAAALAIAAGLGVFSSNSSSERFQVALASPTNAAGTHGDATLTKTPSGWRIELHATGLPRLDDGRFYEAWLKNATGTLVPVGTFNDGRNVTLWAGVSPKQFQTLSVTRERADGNQASSGEKVLVGKVDVGGG
jgi:hypothetical protein